MKLLICIALLLSIPPLNALEDFEQVWVFDSLSQTEFIVNASFPVQYHFHAMVNGTHYVQNLEADQWLYGWQKGSLEVPGYVGFTRGGADPLVNPVFSALDPQIYATTLLTDDAMDDHLYNNTMLDIIEYRITYTDDRLYLAIKTSSPDYLTSSGFTYYAYMPVIVDPAADMEDNPIVYGLMYTVDMSPIISPGLYKITGSGFDGLSRLGDIEHSIQDGYLILSCSIADLRADVDFSSWYDPVYPLFGTTATTSRITLVNGIQQADITQGVKVLLKPHYVEYQNLGSPVLSNPQVTDTGSHLVAGIEYYDADANVPLLATVSVDGAEPHPLHPMDTDDLNYLSTVTYASDEIQLSSTWQSLTFSFSDGSGIQQTSYANPNISTADAIQSPMLQLYPNPVNECLFIKTDRIMHDPVYIYNLRGQRVATLDLRGKEAVADISNLIPGVYILRASGLSHRRFVKL